VTGNTETAGRVYDAALHLLDRQILDCEQQPVAKVDDVELRMPDDGGPPVVTALLCGPAALGPRLGGRLGEWVVAAHRRVAYERGGKPVRIPFEVVKAIDNSVDLTVNRDASGALTLDHWVRDHIVGRLPGAFRRSEKETSGNDAIDRTMAHALRDDEHAAEQSPAAFFRMSALLGVTVHDETGAELGEVHDAMLVQDGPPIETFGAALRMHGLLAGRGSTWARLGFDRDRVSGPWVFKALARRASSRALFLPWHAVRSRDGDRVVVEARHQRPVTHREDAQ
jgi:sporulation protein YlmC with PRC-barrel domain